MPCQPEPQSKELRDLDQERLRDACDRLAAHFSSVQIFATRSCKGAECGTTMPFESGSGDWFARYGLVRDWLLREEERTRIGVREG